MAKASHHSIREAMLRRIQSGEWELGALIPAEMTLAKEYDCARTTVNRALQALADDGLLVRKRKGGTRVCKMPVRKAKFEIPVIRNQIETTGDLYQHKLLRAEMKKPPTQICTRLNISNEHKAMYLETLHLSNSRPFVFETRWINTDAVPKVLNAPLETISANEWLVKTVPFSSGEVIFSAVSSSKNIAKAMDVELGSALFVIDRTTWFEEAFITTTKLYYKEGFQLYSRL